MSKKMNPCIYVGISEWNYGHWKDIFLHYLLVITPANNYTNPVIPEKLVLDLIGERESI
jgi:hypothetical protein